MSSLLQVFANPAWSNVVRSGIVRLFIMLMTLYCLWSGYFLPSVALQNIIEIIVQMLTDCSF